MPTFSVSASKSLSDPAVLALYSSVGWTAYTNDVPLLMQAIKNSSFVVSAWSQDDKLIGIARVISDDATICYLQDILVDPSFQGSGVGRALFAQVKERYQHVRQIVLITDDEPQQRAFYQAMGLTEDSDMKPGPTRVFARLQ